MPAMLEPASPQTLVQQIAGIEAKPLWLGPCAEGPNGGITQSMLQSYLGCRERFRLKYVLGLEPQPRFSRAMEYGNMWHACEEQLAATGIIANDGIDVFTKLDQYATGLLDKYPMQRDEVHKWWMVCRMQFPEYVRHWQDHPDVVDRRPLMQEQVFDVPYRLPSGRTVRLRGKFDSIDLIPSQGGIYIQENKSKGDIDPVNLLRQLRFDIQTMYYIVALIIMKEQMRGA